MARHGLTWDKVTWPQFLKRVSSQAGFNGACARLCLLIGGDSPSKTKYEIQARLSTRKITEQEAKNYTDAMVMMVEERQRSKGAFVSTVTPETWEKVKGGHMKRTFIEGFNEGYEHNEL